MDELVKNSAGFEKMISDIEALENTLLNLNRMAMRKQHMEKICFPQYQRS